jgi:hypothetical protein
MSNSSSLVDSKLANDFLKLFCVFCVCLVNLIPRFGFCSSSSDGWPDRQLQEFPETKRKLILVKSEFKIK